MEYKVFIFSSGIFDGRKSFDFNKFNQVCGKYLVEINQIVITKYKSYSLALEKDNLIIFCDNKNIDQLIYSNIDCIGRQKKVIEDKIAVFGNDERNIVFIPIEFDINMLEHVFIEENRNYSQFHLFGLRENEVVEKLNIIKEQIETLEYHLIYENLVTHIYLSYLGDKEKRHEIEGEIARYFNQYIYSENDLTLALIVYRLLKLKDYKIAIWEISTNGIITSQLFKENSDFASVLEKAKFDYTECKDVDMLYEKALNFKKELSCEIALLVYRQEGEIEDCYQFAICYGNEIFLYKNIFKTDHKISLEMAKNAVLFNLAKKLRQNDITI